MSMRILYHSPSHMIYLREKSYSTSAKLLLLYLFYYIFLIPKIQYNCLFYQYFACGAFDITPISPISREKRGLLDLRCPAWYIWVEYWYAVLVLRYCTSTVLVKYIPGIVHTSILSSIYGKITCIRVPEYSTSN